MKKVIGIISILLVISVLLFSVGCNKKSSSNKMNIGATLLTQSHPFYQAIKTALEDEATSQDVNLSIAIADQDLNRQISQIEDFINKQVDAIIITPVDSDGVAGGISKAKNAGIPVITVDIKANGVEVSSHIATDNYTGGMIAAEAMAQYINESGTLGLITYPEVQSVRDRIDGFKEQIKKYPNISIVVELPGRTREEAKKASEDMLVAHSNINGIFGFGDDMAIAATTAIQQRQSSAVVIGFDGLQEARDFVDEQNAFKAVVRQFPEKMGQEGIRAAVALVKGQSVPSEIPIVPGLYIHGKADIEVTIENNAPQFLVK